MVLIFTTITLIGCGGDRYYIKSDYTPEQWHKDKTECHYQARANTVNVNSVIETAFVMRDLMDLCLKSKGYTLQQQ